MAVTASTITRHFKFRHRTMMPVALLAVEVLGIRHILNQLPAVLTRAHIGPRCQCKCITLPQLQAAFINIRHPTVRQLSTLSIFTHRRSMVGLPVLLEAPHLTMAFLRLPVLLSPVVTLRRRIPLPVLHSRHRLFRCHISSQHALRWYHLQSTAAQVCQCNVHALPC